MLRVLLLACVAAVTAPTFTAAQMQSRNPTVVETSTTNQQEIVSAFSGFTRQNAEVVKSLTETIRRLEEAAKATVETQKVEIGAFKTQLLDLQLLLSPGSALLDRIDHLESAIVAHRDDFQKMGVQLGDKVWADKERAGFDKDLGVLSAKRTQIKEYGARIDRILKDLAQAEARAAYLMLRQTHAAAIKDLEQSLKKIGELLDQAGMIIRDIGTPPSQT